MKSPGNYRGRELWRHVENEGDLSHFLRFQLVTATVNELIIRPNNPTAINKSVR